MYSNTTTINQKPKYFQQVCQGQDIDRNMVYEHLENYLNSKILKITMAIRNQYPELLEFLNEMPLPIPTENNPKITLNNLKKYGESLNSILTKYKLEHS